MTIEAAAPAQVLADRVRDLQAPTSFGRVLGTPPDGAIALTSGSPDASVLPAAEIAEATGRILADPAVAGDVLDYSARPGNARLREWIAAREGVTADRVFITNGALHAISISMLATVNPGDTIVVENPMYPLALSVFQLTGARIEAVPSDAHGLDVDALAAQLEAGLRPRVVYLVPDFQNPSGAVLTAERRARLTELAERYGFLILSDNPYEPLRWAGDRLADFDTASDRVIRANTFSKVFGPGLRVGWLTLPEWVVPGVTNIRMRTDQHASTLLQAVVADLAAGQGIFDRVAGDAAREYRGRAEAFLGELRAGLGDAIDVATPEGGLFAWARFARVDVDAFAAALGDRGILVNPGSQFSAPGFGTAEIAAHVRMTFAKHDAETLRGAARTIIDVHDELAGRA